MSDGGLFSVKGIPQDSTSRRMTVWLHEERSSVFPFGASDQRTMFTPETIGIEKLDGTMVAQRQVPRDSFAGHQMGTQSEDMDGVAREFSDALNREITYSEVSPEEWEQMLRKQSMPEHLTGHLLAMGELHRAGRHDSWADGVQRVIGWTAMSVREFVSLHPEEFGGRRS